MQIHAPDAQVPESARGAAIALGNFDGVHVGHQAVAGSARAAGRALGAGFGVAVFSPHPRRVFQPNAPPFLLQTAAQRARALARLGAAYLFEIGFDPALAGLSDREFCERVLVGRLGVRHVSVGADFRYGRARMGDITSLAAHGAEFGFSVAAVDAVDDDAGHQKVSSSSVREAVRRGAMDEAAQMLGRPWAVEGEVLRGFQRGRTLGVPTANIALGAYVRPRLGVYGARVDIGAGAPIAAAVSVGVNPSVGGLPEPLLEAHLLDFSGDLYGRIIEVAFVRFLRDEAHFDSLDALKAQMARDIVAARSLLSAAP